MPDNAYGWTGSEGESRKEGRVALEALGTTDVPLSSSSSLRSPSFNLLTRAEKERKNGMGLERKRKGGWGASKRANRVRPVILHFANDRPTERDYRLTILHCVTICPSSLSAGKGVLISDDNDYGATDSHCSFGGICAGGTAGAASDLLLPCESERVSE